MDEVQSIIGFFEAFYEKLQNIETSLSTLEQGLKPETAGGNKDPAVEQLKRMDRHTKQSLLLAKNMKEESDGLIFLMKKGLEKIQQRAEAGRAEANREAADEGR
ncbi:hypothetical protein ACQY0O_005596 [Thecaphora frezii]